MTRTFATSSVTPLLVCEECDVHAEQNLTDITDVGTLICTECGQDMTLDDHVRVSDA